MHRPSNSEVEYYTTLKTNECRAEVINGESLGIPRSLVVILGILSEEIGNVSRNGQRLRLVDSIQHKVKSVAADVTKRTDTARFLFDECTARNTATASTTCLNVVYLAKYT